jgi:O-succinylbenzoate synthase
MALQATFVKKTFQFGFKARTSRGLMRDKTSWFIKLWDDRDPLVTGLGECGPLPGLSIDARPDFEDVLRETLQTISDQQLSVEGAPETLPIPHPILEAVPPDFPAILFGLETAWLDLLQGGRRLLYQNKFSAGQPIPINGLIWMGDLDFMMNQINQKIAQGFTCIKLKVGGLDFDRECDVLDYIRKRYYKDNITIRLDANGAFKIDEALFKLSELARFKIHSIEQPIKAGLPEMEELCRKSPVPVAFDEELIGVRPDAREELLTRLKPSYIILKPMLHGGLSGCAAWIAIAERLGIGWWITSALESNIGLNAICQFTARYAITIPQGLGTGAIYTDNIPSPLVVEQGKIFHDPERSWDTGLSL